MDNHVEIVAFVIQLEIVTRVSSLLGLSRRRQVYKLTK